MKKQVVWSGLINHNWTPKRPDRRIAEAYWKSQPSWNTTKSSKYPAVEKTDISILCHQWYRTPQFQKSTRNRADLRSPGWQQSWTWFWLTATERYQRLSKYGWHNHGGKKTHRRRRGARSIKVNHLTKRRSEQIATLGLHPLSMPSVNESTTNSHSHSTSTQLKMDGKGCLLKLERKRSAKKQQAD